MSWLDRLNLWLDSHPDITTRLTFWTSVLVLAASFLSYNVGYERGVQAEFQREIQLGKLRDQQAREAYEAFKTRRPELFHIPIPTESRGN